MKTKMLVGMSVAVALGAAAGGGIALQKPTVVNQRVYSSNNKVKQNNQNEKSSYKENSTKNQKVNITLYEFKSLASYESQTFDSGVMTPLSVTTGKPIKENNKFIPIGKVATQKFKGKTHYFPGSNEFKKVNIEVPIGTKFNLLYSQGFYSIIDYQGTPAWISNDYLNMDNIPNNYEGIMRLYSQKESSSIKTVGTAVTTDMNLPKGVPGSPVKPWIEVLCNGQDYELPIKSNTKINLIKKNGISEFKVNTGTFGGTKEVYIEYNGIVGYINVANLKNINYKK